MTPERWQHVKRLLEGALDLAPDERTAFVDRASEGDEDLRREVLTLLDSTPELDDFIEAPVIKLLAEPQGLAEGSRLGAYQILRELGRGGMGTVYLGARAEDYERRVAIKVVRRGMDTEEILRRFRQERQILANLTHPNIAGLLDGGTTESGLSYFVMEYVEGTPIDAFCRSHRLSGDARLELFKTVCLAVHFAHQNLVVHRDLKPANILVTEGGSPKLLDFGIAKLLSTELPLSTQMIQPGLKLMTPEYASPEQLAGGQITTATDVYGLGLLLHLLLVGTLPLRVSPGGGPARAESAGSRPKGLPAGEPAAAPGVTPRSEAALGPEPPPRRFWRRPSAPPLLAGDLRNIVWMCLRTEPARRYPSAQALADDVSRHLTGMPVVAREDTLLYRAGKFVRRNRAGVAVASLLLLLVLAFSVTVSVLLGQSLRAQQRAEREQHRAEKVTDLMVDVLSKSDPARARGEKVLVREVLDSGSKKIRSELPDDPETRATLIATMGRVYRNLGLFDPAGQLLQEAVNLRRAVLGSNSPLLADSLNDLGFVLYRSGHSDAAERAVREALDIRRRTAHGDDLELARVVNSLAILLESKGHYDEAENLFGKSLAMRRRLSHGDNSDVAMAMNSLAELRERREDLDGAESLYREALAMSRRLRGSKPDPDVATILNNLATVLEDRGDLTGAEGLYREALEMRRRLFKGGGREVARSLNNLGRVLTAEHREAAAEGSFREALTLIEQPTLNPRDPDRATFQRNFAALLVAAGRPGEAESLAHEALASFRQRKIEAWQDTDVESVLGGALAAQGRFGEAEALLQPAYQSLARLGARRQAAEALDRLIGLYTAWGKTDQAAAYRALKARPIHSA